MAETVTTTSYQELISEERSFDAKQVFKNVDCEFKQGLFFARQAKHAYLTEGYVDAQIVGEKSIGKTSYALWNLRAAYGDWDTAFKFLFMQPRLLLKVLQYFHNKKIRLPMICQDDAGRKLNRSRWYLDETMDFAEFYDLVKSVCSGFLFTEPSFKLPGSIEKTIKYTVMMRSVSQKKLRNVLLGGDNKALMWKARYARAVEEQVDPLLWCKATLYSRYTRPDGAIWMSNIKHTDYYPLHYPNSVKENVDIVRRNEVTAALDKALNKEEKKDHMGERLYLAYKEFQKLGYTNTQIADKLGYKKFQDLSYHIGKYIRKSVVASEP